MSERIKTPTVHITGRNDPFFKQTNLAKTLFDKENTRFFEHSGGHDVPRIDSEVKSAVAAVQWVIQRSQMVAPRGWKTTLKSLRK
jgi:predicted alpha/beta-fold hydrolase